MPTSVLFPHRLGARWFALLVVFVVATGGLALGMQPAGASTFTVTATGRFAYTDDSGRLIGINGARVEMCNDDSITGCPTMSVGVTNADGFYTITGSGGDFFDGPDPLVKVTATGPSGFVQPGNFPPVDYCFASVSRSNAGNGTINFGTLTPSNTVGCNWPYSPTSPGTDGAWQLWNNAKEAWDFMRVQTLRNPGVDMPPVKVVWPMSSTAYNNNQINVATSHAFREAAFFHEYGHHIMRNFAESPAPNYNNGVCDTISLFNIGGHCFWRSENPPIAWTEGWPSYFAEVMTTSLGKNDTISSMFGCDPVVSTICGSVEFPPQPSPDSNLANVEGTVAAILWDLVDGSTDNHDFDNSADALNIGFPAVWDVYMNRDPDPFTAHNKILNLDELWDGFAALRPLELNRLSAIYDENGITKPSADLAVTSASISETSVAPGDVFVVNETTTNIGAVRPGLGSATGYFLEQAPFGTRTLIGARNVNDLIPNASSAGSVNVGVPASTASGNYAVMACSDWLTQHFETSETNNCRQAGVVNVAPRTISIGPASFFEGNSGITTVYLPVALSSVSPTDVTVNYATSDGTATAGRDYLATTGSITIPAGSPSGLVPVNLIGDTRDERDFETFNVTLSGAVGATISPATASGTIIDDDPTPSLRVNNVQVTEGNSGSKNMTFRVSVSAASGKIIKVNWKTVNGTAVAPSDYVASNNTLTIPRDTLSGTFSVPIKGDTVVEPNETLKVTLSNPVNATIADGTGVGTIVNND